VLRRAAIEWHGVRLGCPDWADDSHSIACTVRPSAVVVPLWLHLICNAYWEPLDFDLPAVPEQAESGWRRWIDTARRSPEDIVDPVVAPLVAERQYHVMPRSFVALILVIGSGSNFTVDADA